MKERPILFSTPMVRAIIGNRKNMTRRVVKSHTGLFEVSIASYEPESNAFGVGSSVVEIQYSPTEMKELGNLIINN